MGNFTGNKDVDRSILLRLNDVELSNICATNTYFKSLCSEESFWRTKTLSRFGKYLGGIEEIQKYTIRYHFQTWKLYYISLIDFLEKKYLGYFVPAIRGSRKIVRRFEDFRIQALKRDDISKLNDIIDKNDAMLIENMESFLSKIPSVKTFDMEIFKIFMDSQLNNDMLNPSVIFSINPFNGRPNIEQFLEQIITYLLNSKDRRIHPESFDNEFLKTLFTYADLFEEKLEIIEMVLNDPRVDPNAVLNEIASVSDIPDDLINLVLSDPRIKLYKLRETIKEYIEDPDTVAINGLLKIFEAFLERGGTLDELKYMIENIQTHDDDVTVYYEQFIINHSSTLKDQIISKLSYERYSDDIYEKILTLLNK